MLFTLVLIGLLEEYVTSVTHGSALSHVHVHVDLTVKKEKLETLHKLISRLPDLNYIVFERFIFHLARYNCDHIIHQM